MSAPTPAPGDDRPREGYYPDPSIPGYVRYWNGAAWVPGTSRPAPSGGEPLAPPPGAGPAGGSASVEETGPHFFDEDPAPAQQYGSRPEPASAWGADRSQQSGFGGDQDRRVSWGNPNPQGKDPRVQASPDGQSPSADGTATAPPAEQEREREREPDFGAGDVEAGGTFVFRRPTAGSASGTAPSAASGPGGPNPDPGTVTFRAPVPRTPHQGGAPGAQPGSTGAPSASGQGTPGTPATAGTAGTPGSGAQGAAGAAAFGGAQGPAGAAAGSGAAAFGGPGGAGFAAQGPFVSEGVGGGFGTEGSAGPAGAAAAGGQPGFPARGPAGAAGPGGGAGTAEPGFGAAAGSGQQGLPAQGPVGAPASGGAAPAAGFGAPAAATAPAAKPGFAAGKAAAERAAAQSAQAAAQASAPALSSPQQAAQGVPQQSGAAQPAAAPAASAAPMSTGPGGGQHSWAQQVHQLAANGDDQPVAPWKPPVEDLFQAAARRQAAARPAGIGKRLAARLVDTLVLGAVTAAAAFPLGTKAVEHVNDKIDAAKLTGETVTVWLLDGTTSAYLGIVLAVMLVFGIVYEALPTAKWGRTLGKKLFGLEVRDIEGHEPPSFGAALRRWLVYSVPGLLAVGVVGVLWGLFDRPWRQCWHDKAAHTFVAG